MSSDRIEKSIVLRAPRARVWRALTTPDEFGRWFGARLAGDFAPGAHVTGQMTAPGNEHFTFEMVVEQIQPEGLFSYRWHPYAVGPAVDYAGEPMTLVEMRLAEVPGGTQLTVTESGFDRLAPARRAEAFPMNEQGWAGQLQNIQSYVSA